MSMMEDFPILSRIIDGNRLVYLDNAATSQKPFAVIDAISEYYTSHNANVHRGLHSLSEEATALFENSRRTIAHFIGAQKVEEIIFTKGTTESLNRVAFEWALPNLNKDDVILITDSEHHSNLVPWQIVSERTGCKLDFIKTTDSGDFDFEDFKNKLTPSVKLVSVAHASNVLGTIFPVKEISKEAHKLGALVCVDGAQAVPHLEVNVQNLGCDFYAFSGHKMLGPMGIGVLWTRSEILSKLEPYEYGGGMIDDVGLHTSTWAEIPEKFEAGTPNVEGAVGLAAAVKYLENYGMDKVRRHEISITEYALTQLLRLPYVQIIGPLDPQKRTGLVSFTLGSIHAHDVAAVLNSLGVAVRSGHHCTMPLHKRLGIPASTRASWYIYNTNSDIDVLVEGIKKAKSILG